MTFPEHAAYLAVVMVFFLLCMLWLNWLIKRDDNDLKWEDLVSVHGQDGKNHADWTKIGQGAGVFVATFIPLQYAVKETFDPSQGAIIMSASLLYLGGVAAYSSSLRAKTQSDKPV